MALSDPHPAFTGDTVADSSILNAKLTALFNALGINTYPGGVYVTDDETFTEHVRHLDAALAEIADRASPLGYRVNMDVTLKDTDEFYVSAGGLEMGGSVYTVAAQLTKAVTTSAGTEHTEYAYADPPASGSVLTADDIEYGTDVPVWSESRQGYYHPTNTDQRCIGELTFSSGDELTAATTYPVSEAATLEAKLLGYISGLGYAYKDADELTFAGGSVEINGALYALSAATDVQFAGLGNDEWRYIYVEAPASGTTLAAAQITSTTTAPTKDHAKGGAWYNAGGTARCIGFFLTDGSANILEAYINKGRYVPASFLTALAISGDNTTQTLVSVGLPALGRVLAEYSGIVSHGSADYCWLYIGNGDDNALNSTNDMLAGGRAGGATSYFGRGGSLDRLSDEDGKILYKTSTGVDGAVIVIRSIAVSEGMAG